MKLIIGLGNPGEEYVNTRHNAGHMTVAQFPINNSQFTIVKTNTFMNDSGSFVAKTLKAYGIKPEALYVAHDDLDIKLGEYKIQFAKGPKDHNGIESIETELGTKDFWRIRIGVDNRASDEKNTRTPGERYVLEKFSDEELQILNRVINEICEKLKKI